MRILLRRCRRIRRLCAVAVLMTVVNGMFLLQRIVKDDDDHSKSPNHVRDNEHGVDEDDSHSNRKRRYEPCRTTLNVTALSRLERGLLLYTAPPPLQNEIPNTILSWIDALAGRGTVVVLTNDAVTRQLCADRQIPTQCVEHTDEGLPRLDRMFQRMHRAAAASLQQSDNGHGMVAYVNSDLSVHNVTAALDLLESLQTRELEVYQPSSLFQPFQNSGRTSSYWFAVSTRIDVSHSGEHTRHTKGGYDFWAWNTKAHGLPLLPFDVPPFRFPFSTYDNWLLDMQIQSGQRNVIDMSQALEIYHHEHTRVGGSAVWGDILKRGVTGVFLSKYLAHNEPRTQLEAADTEWSSSSSPFATIHHIWQFGTPVDCPYQVKALPSGEFEIVQRPYWTPITEDQLMKTDCTRNSECKQVQRILKQTQAMENDVDTLPFVDGAKPHGKLLIAAAQHWRYTIHEQLQQHATADGFVLLTAVNFAYREHLMNFKCALERVGLNDHFVIAAMDEKMYKWGVLQGLPIYLAGSAECSVSSSESGGIFGSTEFKSVTKLKSVAVLEVLNAGYSVIWSDVDIMWFINPFDALAPYMKTDGGLAIQSNAPYAQNPEVDAIPHETVGKIKGTTDDPAGYRRLNSGLYVAPNNALVKSAFIEIVAHASTSTLTEQPSFDEILCARKPSERGYSSCEYRTMPSWIQKAVRNVLNVFYVQNPSTALHVEVLDRFNFPNGAVLVGEKNENAFDLGRETFSRYTKSDLFASHNNWILGEEFKKKRQQQAGWWFIDDIYSCRYDGDE